MSNRHWPPSQLIELRSSGRRAQLLGLSTDLIAESIRRDGGFESSLAEMAMEQLQAQPPGTVIDVGANIGSFAIALALNAPDFRLLCFEAQRLVAYQLAGAVALNGLASVHVFHQAVGDTLGDIEITAPDYAIEPNVGAMSLDSDINALRGATTQGARERVRMVTLDSLDVTDLRLSKVDVEGMELNVLKGSERLLARNGFPPILAECWQNDWFSDHRAALVAWFELHGYVLKQHGDNYLATHRSRPVRPQMPPVPRPWV